METFALYLLKSAVWLTGFAATYFLFLRNERFFVLNRIFLVAGIVASLVFPFFTWHYTVVFPASMPTAEISDLQIRTVTTTVEPFTTKDALLYIYLIGALYLIFRISKQTYSVWQVIRKSETLHFNTVKLIRTNRYPHSFSFFSFVFVNPSTDETETNEIVNHEQEHIRQRHWIDLLLFEILCTVQWFNPVIWLFGRFIRQNHEFLADEYALRRSPNPAIYRAALLNQMFGGPVISLANSFNYSINKKRFNMMRQITYSPFRKLKLLLVMPLIAGVFYAFAAPEYKLVQAEKLSANPTQSEKTIKGKVTDENGRPLKNASVIISGTTIGTVTDDNGYFMLKMTDESLLVVSYVGYATRNVKPDFGKEMVIQTNRIIVGIEPDGKTTIVSNPDDFINPPLYVVDGKEMSKKEMEKINPDQIEAISVLKNKEFTAKYGEKGKNGVVLITLKKSPAIKFSAKEAKYDKDVLTIKEPSQLDVKSKNGKQPLLVIDGVFTGSKKLEDIDPNTIESMSVWKDEKAIEKYGDQGKNGVIEIILKKNQNNNTKNENSNLDVVGYANDQKSTEKSGIQIRSTGIAGNPLIVVDGVISSKKVEDIDPKTIESVNVWTKDKAIKKYGDNGKDGVVEITIKKEKEVFVIVEQMPEFPGGFVALKEYVRANLQYPKNALEKGIEGKVYVNFMVSKTGAVSNAKVAKSTEPLLDEEALRIVKSMPNWTPGKQHGEAVEVSYTLPIDFNLPQKN
jgi:TonB family protein